VNQNARAAPPDVDISVSTPRDGRLRLTSRYFFADPTREICRQLVAKLFEVADVRAVEILTSRASAQIEYVNGVPDPEVVARIGRHLTSGESLGTYAAALGEPPLAFPEGADAWRIERHGRVLSTWEVRHALPGRIRLRSRLIRRAPELCRVIHRVLEQTSGVDLHTTSPRTATTLIVYDPARVDPHQLVEILDRAIVEAGREGSLVPGGGGANGAEEGLFKERAPTRLDAAALGVSLVLSAAGDWFGIPVLSLLSVPGTVWASRGLYRNGILSLVRDGKLTVETLLIVAHVAGMTAGYFFLFTLITAASEVTRMLLNKIKRDSRGQYTDIFLQEARSVWVRVDGVDIEVPLQAVKAGDLVSIGAGQTIPVDGHITEGAATIDQQPLTGEAAPADKGLGDPVFAMTVVLSGQIVVRVEKTGAATAAAHIARMLDKTVDFKTGRKLRAERIADRLVTPTFGVGLLAWPLLGASAGAALVDSHPKNKMTLAYSVGMLNYFTLAARQGLLIKDARALERLTEVDTVVFDKTGTLTRAEPRVGRLYTRAPYTADALLTVAAAVERHQSHPIARAITRLARSRGLAVPAVEDADYRVGYGLSVTIDGRPVCVGSLRLLELEGIAVPPSVVETQARCHAEGHSLVVIAIDGEVAGAIELRATLRPEARRIVDGLRERGVRSIYIVSGDHEAPTRRLAEALGVDRYFAETLPEDKAALIGALREAGRVICYVGDGINDSIAMKTSRVSVSLRGASTLATDTADVVLLDESLTQLCRLFDLARACERSMRTTLGGVLLPSAVCVAGILLFGFGLMHSRLLTIVGVGTGVGTAMLPLLTHRTTVADPARDQAPAPPDADVVPEEALG
jgi:heavy metal translocating P-type ATPase